MHHRTILTFGLALIWASAVFPAGAAGDEVLTVVFSKAHNGYVRAKLPDGSFKAETYAYGEGEHATGQERDDSVDGFPFLKLARLLTPYLARQNYLPGTTAAGTDLLLMVHWGRTIPFGGGSYRMTLGDVSRSMAAVQRSTESAGSAPVGPIGSTQRAEAGGVERGVRAALNGELTSNLMMLNLQNRLRDQANARNAGLLGYLPEMSRIDDLKRFAGLGTYYSDLESDLEEDRYYVILAAYDFQTAWKQKQRKLLWVTRVNIRVRGNRFDEQLDAMIRSASRYVGRDSPGLVRQFERQGVVEIGEPQLIEYQTPR
jgi:hypothetical protein